MNIQKTYWDNSENSMALHFPITKVNKEKRTVSGFATLDNLDRHGDVVTAEASKKAFDNFRGNIREMHGASAVGKMVNFKEDNYFDPETQKKYTGIYVTAYISKGAQDAWEKCLDGTYSGFSIGGNIVDAKMEKLDDDSETHRVIHNFDLHELSLVDSPANQLANIFSIQKMAEGIVTENVFWCDKDEVASTTTATEKSCVVCESTMTNIGWVEQADIEKFEAIEKVIDSYFKKDDAPTSNHEATESAAPGLAGTNVMPNVVDTTVATLMYPDQNKKDKVTKSEEISLIEGGKTMAEDTNTVIEKSVDVEAPAEEVAVIEEVASAADNSIEKAVSISEVENAFDFEKMVNDLKTFFGESITKNYSDSSEALAAVNKMFEETSASIVKQIAELGEKYETLNKSVTDMYGKIEYVNNQLSNFESASAVKKSSDQNGSLENNKQLNKSVWQGAFLKVNSLN